MLTGAPTSGAVLAGDRPKRVTPKTVPSFPDVILARADLLSWGVPVIHCGERAITRSAGWSRGVVPRDEGWRRHERKPLTRTSRVVQHPASTFG